MAATRFPPTATAPIRANCDAPVKASALSAQACQALSPEPAAAAPNASPDTPTASPSPRPSRTGPGTRAPGPGPASRAWASWALAS